MCPPNVETCFYHKTSVLTIKYNTTKQLQSQTSASSSRLLFSPSLITTPCHQSQMLRPIYIGVIANTLLSSPSPSLSFCSLLSLYAYIKLWQVLNESMGLLFDENACPSHKSNLSRFWNTKKTRMKSLYLNWEANKIKFRFLNKWLYFKWRMVSLLLGACYGNIFYVEWKKIVLLLFGLDTTYSYELLYV